MLYRSISMKATRAILTGAIPCKIEQQQGRKGAILLLLSDLGGCNNIGTIPREIEQEPQAARHFGNVFRSNTGVEVVPAIQGHESLTLNAIVLSGEDRADHGRFIGDR